MIFEEMLREEKLEGRLEATKENIWEKSRTDCGIKSQGWRNWKT